MSKIKEYTVAADKSFIAVAVLRLSARQYQGMSDDDIENVINDMLEKHNAKVRACVFMGDICQKNSSEEEDFIIAMHKDKSVNIVYRKLTSRCTLVPINNTQTETNADN